MLDTKLNKAGTVLMHDDRIYVEGFDADGCMCREVAIHAVTWAIGELQRELVALIEKPGGGKSAMDLPPAVHEALGLPDPLDD